MDEQKKKMLFIGLGVAAAGGLGYFGYREYKKRKEQQEDNSSVDSGLPSLPIFNKKPKGNDSIPLKRGSRGNNVTKLQQALMSKYGQGILPKYGADGVFGSEVEAALRGKGFATTVDQKTFQTITAGAVHGIFSRLKNLIKHRMIATKEETFIWRNKHSATKVPANTPLGRALASRNGFTAFLSGNGEKLIVKTSSIKSI
jgi:hypothetical protein